MHDVLSVSVRLVNDGAPHHSGEHLWHEPAAQTCVHIPGRLLAGFLLAVLYKQQAFSVKRYPPPMMACLWLMACLCMKVFMFMCN